MSYLPEYILDRIFPIDSFKAAPGGVNIHLVNVISPLSMEEIPPMPDRPEETIEDLIEVTFGKKVFNKEQKREIKFTLNTPEGDVPFTIDNIKSIEGRILPIGEKMTIFLPTDEILKEGQRYSLELLIKVTYPFHFQINRDLNASA